MSTHVHPCPKLVQISDNSSILGTYLYARMIDMLGNTGVKYPDVQVFKHVLFNIHLEFMLKESSLSSRWNTEDMAPPTYERNNIYIAELGCTMGQAWGA